MVPFDEVLAPEDEYARKLEELQEFNHDRRNWSFRSEKSDADPRFHKRVADLSATYFPLLEARQQAADNARARLQDLKRRWLEGV